MTRSNPTTPEICSSWFPGIDRPYDYSRYAVSSAKGDVSAGRSEDDVVSSEDAGGGWGGAPASAGRSGGSGCADVPVSVTRSDSGCEDCGEDVSSVIVGRSDGAVCDGTGSNVSSIYGSSNGRAGSFWERADVFSDGGDLYDGDLAAGTRGSAGRPVASAKGFCKTNSTASLACGSVAISTGSEGGVSIDAGNSTGLCVSSSDRFAAGSSSPASKTGMRRSAVPLML